MIDLIFRHEVKESDIEQIENLVINTGFFNKDEVQVAKELVEEAWKYKEKSGYYFCFADVNGKIAGYTCYGQVPMTVNCYDLYWIAVRNNYQNKGLGTILLKKTEEIIQKRQGRKIYIETSESKMYVPTINFYIKNDYEVAAKLLDFYDVGINKIIFLKNLTISEDKKVQ